MSKGQTTEKKIKSILKYFKMNEDSISTLMGIVVIVVIAGLIFNYFKSANLKTWQGMLNQEQAPATTSNTKEDMQTEKYLAVYKVVKGDDLWHISEKFYKSGYNYVDIIKENKIDKSGVITAGAELRIPKVEAKKITIVEIKKEIAVKDGKFEATKTEPKAADSSVKTTIALGEYTTVKGDSLWSIAVRAYGDGFKWTKIYWENKKAISNPDVIYSNVKLSIPVLK